MRKLVLALPVMAAILQADRLWPFPRVELQRRPIKALSEELASLPARDIGKFERPADPLNMLFLGTEASVQEALEGAGWTRIPIPISDAFWRGLGELLRGEQLRSFPPMSDFRVLGRVQDMNWVLVIKPIETRHHFRLWRTGLHDARGRELWWGSGNFDLSWRMRDFSHRPHPDMNLERDYLAKTLEGSPLVEKASLVALPQIPREGVNAHGYPFTSDGRALLVELR